jgi:ribosomal protein S18 acetylase RimI-like enzyme
MGEIAVRRIGPDDADELRAFSEAFDEPLDADQTARFLADERHHLLVGYVDGAPAGFVSATEILHPDKHPELFLNELSVIERHRRRGAATALMSGLRTLAHELGCAEIWVLTQEDNAAAIATYRRAGGRWDGVRQVMFEVEVDPGPDADDA